MADVPRKTVGQRTYFHESCISLLDAPLQETLRGAERIAAVRPSDDYNLIRYEPNTSRIAFLNYSNFFDELFPTLKESWRVDLALGEVSYRTYEDSLNPPILHRKELLLPSDHPRRTEYEALTETAESIGLFDDSARIGYQRQWLQLVREKGYQIVGQELVPLGNDEAQEDEGVPLHADWSAARQLTALVRYGFSAPVQSLARYGFLDGRYTIFDYGCGRGDDIKGLVANGLSAAGWDPYYAPERPLINADLVNLGFVINVIESLDERVDALVRAFSLAKYLLIVSVMLANGNNTQGESFRDGVLTKRRTFQKYYTPAELKTFIERTLNEEAIPVAPGILYLFRDKDTEQRFLTDRYRSRRSFLYPPPAGYAGKRETQKPDRTAEKYNTYKESLERLWCKWVSLGRKPHKSETEDLITLTDGFGSLGKALRFIEARKDPTEIEHSRRARLSDLEIYFALAQFEGHRHYTQLEQGLRRDVKEFFGDYRDVQSSSRGLLFQIADIAAINRACQEAAEHGLGWLEENGSLQLHSSLVEQLPPLLRVYVGCATVVYGDYHNADLVKIHIPSSKISLLKYDDFEGTPLPRMTERVKIKLREREFEYYAYREEHAPPFLYHKSRYINEEFSRYSEQLAFEEALEALGLFDLSGHGPKPVDFLETLRKNRFTIKGFSLTRSRTVPELDEPCGKFLTFRQLIECGETQAQIQLANLPQQADTYNALLDLVTHIVDPVIEYFGPISLTYGFCSSGLAKEIAGRIDPQRDQHAGHELNQRGKLICRRLGCAVDFIVNDESMLEVVQWVVKNTPFDRLYFYGDDKPIHVSYGPNNDRQIVQMLKTESGRLIPRVTGTEEFLSLETDATRR